MPDNIWIDPLVEVGVTQFYLLYYLFIQHSSHHSQEHSQFHTHLLPSFYIPLTPVTPITILHSIILIISCEQSVISTSLTLTAFPVHHVTLILFAIWSTQIQPVSMSPVHLGSQATFLILCSPISVTSL